MLNLTTKNGERLEIPETWVIAVIEPVGKQAKSGIMYDPGQGPITQFLSDNYGFVKKLMQDSGQIMNPIEVRILEPFIDPKDETPDGEMPMPKVCEGKMFFARSRIIGRQELLNQAEGAHAKLYVNLTGSTREMWVADTLYELDGEPNPKRKPELKAVEDENNVVSMVTGDALPDPADPNLTEPTADKEPDNG